MNGDEQVQQNAINPKRTFEATYEGSMNTMNAIRNFFEAHKSGELFYFTDSQGIQRTVRFASNDFEMQVQFGFSGNDTKPTPQGGMVTLQFREVLT